MVGIDRKTQHPPCPGQRLQHVMRLVAQGRVPPVRVGMGDGDGPRGMVDCLQRGAFGGMAHVDDHADAVHLRHHLFAHAGQAGIVILVAARRQQRLVVVGQLHEADAELVADLDQTDVVLDGAGVLKAEEDRRPPLGLRAAHAVGAGALEDQVGMILEPAVPAFEVQHHFAERLVIGDCHMHGVHPALAHLRKDAGGEIGVLQVVDERRCHGPQHGRNRARAQRRKRHPAPAARRLQQTEACLRSPFRHGGAR